MKGNEVDNRRRFRQLSPRAQRERQLAEQIRRDELELTPNGELRPKPDQQVTTKAQEPTYQLSNATWE